MSAFTAQELYEKLSAKFEDADVKTNPKRMKYIPFAIAIDRLNQVLGVGGWSTHEERSWYDEKADYVFSTMTLVLHLGDHDAQITRTAGSSVKRFNKGDNAGDDIEFGDDYKSAQTEALKKCLLDIGVGLYLAIEGERNRGSGDGYTGSAPQSSGSHTMPTPASGSTATPMPAPTDAPEGSMVVKITEAPKQRTVNTRRDGEKPVGEANGVLLTGEVVRISMWEDGVARIMALQAGQSVALTDYKEGSPYKGMRQFTARDFVLVGENTANLTPPQAAQPGASAPVAPPAQTAPAPAPGKGDFTGFVTITGNVKQKALERNGQQVTLFYRTAKVASASTSLPAELQVTVAAYDTVGGTLSAFPANEQVYVTGHFVTEAGKSTTIWADSLKTMDEVLADASAAEEDVPVPGEDDEPPRLAGLGD